MKLPRQPRKLPTPPAKPRKTQVLPLAKPHKPQVRLPQPLAKQAPMPQQKLQPPQVTPPPPLRMQPRLQVKLQRKQRPSRSPFP